MTGGDEWAAVALRLSKDLEAANAAYETLCEAVVPGMRNGSAAAMSMSAGLLHKRVADAEKATAERIASWLESHVSDGRDAEHSYTIDSVAKRIREGEWKR